MKPSWKPLTPNTGTARPGEGVQSREEGARLPQHARTAAGDIIELTGAHSQGFHAVKHVYPPQPAAQITTRLSPARLPAATVLLPLLTSLTEAVTTTQPAAAIWTRFPPLSTSPLLSLSVPADAELPPTFFPSRLECRSGSLGLISDSLLSPPPPLLSAL